MGPRGPRLQSSPRIPGPWRRRVRPLILVGPVVVLSAALLLSSAAGRRSGAPDLRPGGASPAGAGLLVLLRQRSSLLPERADVRRGVDQGPAEASVVPRVFPSLWSRARVASSLSDGSPKEDELDLLRPA